MLGVEQLSFAETPAMNVIVPSCLTFTLYREYNNHLFRIIQNTTNALNEIHNFRHFKAQGTVQQFKVDLPVGEYSLIFECQHMEMETTYLIIDDVHVSDEACNVGEEVL